MTEQPGPRTRPGADASLRRFPGAARASSGSTVSPVLDPAVGPASGTESAWTEPTEPAFVAAAKVSTEPPVRRARTASLESTVTRVGSPRRPEPDGTSRSLSSVGTDCGCRSGRCSEGTAGDGTCECDLGWRGVLCEESTLHTHSGPAPTRGPSRGRRPRSAVGSQTSLFLRRCLPEIEALVDLCGSVRCHTSAK